MGSYSYVKDTQARLLTVKRLRAMYTSLAQLAPVRCTLSCGWSSCVGSLSQQAGQITVLSHASSQPANPNPNLFIVRESDASTWLWLSWYTITRGPTITKRQCLLGISLQIEECTQCSASSWLTWNSWREYEHKTGSHSPPLSGGFRSRISVFSSCPEIRNLISYIRCSLMPSRK